MTVRQLFTQSPARLVGLGAVGVAVLGLGIFAWQAEPASPEVDQQRRPITVQVRRLSPVSSMTAPRTYTGTIRAARETSLGFERSARLTKVCVDEGHAVKAGQVLAELDTRELMAQRAQLLHQKSSQQALLEELKSGPRKQTIAAAEAELRALEAQRMLAQQSFERNQRLRDSVAISQEEFDQSQFAYQTATARRDAAQEQLSELRAGTRQEKIDAQRYEVERLNARLREIELQMEKSRLVAPFTGTISRRDADEGTIVSAAQPILSLVESSRMEAWVGLPVRVAAEIRQDQAFVLQAETGPLSAKVQAVLPKLNAATRTRTAVFLLDAQDASRVVPGQVVRVAIEEERRIAGFRVPTASLTPGTRGLWSALVVVPRDGRNRVVRRDVEVLHTGEQDSLVRGTLKAGDLLIDSGVHRIVPGQEVEPVIAEPSAAQPAKQPAPAADAPTQTRDRT